MDYNEVWFSRLTFYEKAKQKFTVDVGQKRQF